MKQKNADFFTGSPCFAPETWLLHLQNDILPYITMDEALGVPTGNFPTFRFQDGKIASPKRYVRMLGRQAYAYFASYMLTGDDKLFDLGEAGITWIREHAFDHDQKIYAILDEKGNPDIKSPTSIQDICYGLLPFLMHYRLSGDIKSMNLVCDTLDLIMSGPFRGKDGTLIDQLDATLSHKVDFEGKLLNVVSILDMLHAILIPLVRMCPTPQNTGMLKEIYDVLVRNFWDKNIFWNNVENRSDFHAKHVDLGHTSKGYLVSIEARKMGIKIPHNLFDEIFNIYSAASDTSAGWLTDFKDSGVAFRRLNRQWWRILIMNQFISRYADSDSRLIPFLENSCQCWLNSDFIDRGRECRGVREGLKSTGKPYCKDRNNITCKANQWKNSFHEVEHVLYMYLYSCYTQRMEAKLFMNPVSAEHPIAALAMPYSIHSLRTNSLSGYKKEVFVSLDW